MYKREEEGGKKKEVDLAFRLLIFSVSTADATAAQPAGCGKKKLFPFSFSLLFYSFALFVVQFALPNEKKARGGQFVCALALPPQPPSCSVDDVVLLSISTRRALHVHPPLLSLALFFKVKIYIYLHPDPRLLFSCDAIAFVLNPMTILFPIRLRLILLFFPCRNHFLMSNRII